MTKRNTPLKALIVACTLAGATLFAGGVHAQTTAPQAGYSNAVADAANANFGDIQRMDIVLTAFMNGDPIPYTGGSVAADAPQADDTPQIGDTLSVAVAPQEEPVAAVQVAPIQKEPTASPTDSTTNPGETAQISAGSHNDVVPPAPAPKKHHGLMKVWHVATDWLLHPKSSSQTMAAVAPAPALAQTSAQVPAPAQVVEAPDNKVDKQVPHSQDRLFVQADKDVVQPDFKLPYATDTVLTQTAQQSCAQQGLGHSKACQKAAEAALYWWRDPIVDWYPQPIDNYQAVETAKRMYCDQFWLKSKSWKAKCEAAVDDSVNTIQAGFRGKYERAPKPTDIIAVAIGSNGQQVLDTANRPYKVVLMTRGAAIAQGLTPQ